MDKIKDLQQLKNTYLRLYCDARKSSYLDKGLMDLYDDCVRKIYLLEKGIISEYNVEREDVNGIKNRK